MRTAPPPSRPSLTAVTALVLAATVLGSSKPAEPRAAGQRPVGEPEAGASVPDMPIPEGLHELVQWEDLRAVRTFFERVDPIEEPDLPAADGRPRSIEALAEELDDAWQAPYEFVRDAIAYLPYVGMVRGAEGTLRSRAGNSLDQALLLRELLRRRGVSAELVRGRLTWRDAEELVEGAAGVAVEDRETRLLWTRFAADHWWVEATRDGRTVSLDPSFSHGRVGRTRGLEADRIDEIPESLSARLRVEARLGTVELGALEVPTGEVVGVALIVDLVSAVPPSIAAAPRPVSESPAAVDVAGPAGSPRVAGPDDEESGDDSRDPLAAGPGPWKVRLRLAGRTVETEPVDDVELAGLSLGLRIRYPEMPVQALDLPWGGRPSARLAVAFAGGAVDRRRLSRSTRSLHEALVRLAEMEEEAWRDMRPPIAYARAVKALRETAVETWQRFVDRGPESLAWIALASADRFDGSTTEAVLLDSAVRLAVVRWDPPTPEAAGRLAMRLEQPAFVGRRDGSAGVRAVQLARSVVESAMVSELLHGITGNASTTAFDVTLRAAGTGPSLSRWDRGGEVPESWPPPARAQAQDDLGLGYQIIAPRRPVGDAASSVGWWAIAPGGGRTRGWVATPEGPFQGVAELEGPWQSRDLDLLLLGVQSLHRVLPALVGLGDPDGDMVDEVALAVCPAAALVAEILAANLPRGWEPPALELLCGPGAAAR